MNDFAVETPAFFELFFSSRHAIRVDAKSMFQMESVHHVEF